MMEQRWPWLMLGSIFWTAAIGLMATASFASHPLAAGWALLCGMIACLATGKLIVDCAASKECARVETIALMVARETVRQAEVTPIR